MYMHGISVWCDWEKHYTEKMIKGVMQLMKVIKLKLWGLILNESCCQVCYYTAICVGGIQFENFNAPIANMS